MTAPLTPPLSALETRLGLAVGELTGADRDRAQAALDDAATLVAAETPPTTARAWETDAPPLARLIVLKAARREFENPRGLSSEDLGEHSVDLTDTSGVYLTRREADLVRRVATGRRHGFVGTIRTPSAYN